ncbi:hypothetical protein QQA45_04590, partial [Sneathia sanguinegens]
MIIYLKITGGTEAKGQAKDYKLSVKKSTIEGIAKEEAKKFVSDSVKVSSTDGAITVAADKTTDANVINYKLTLNKEKIKELSGTTNLATEYAKVDGTNLTNLDDTNKKAWATGIGTSSIDATTKDELVTDKAVKEYLTTEIGKVNNTVASSALKLSDGTNKESLKLADETLEIANGTNTTVTLTKDANSKKTKFTVDVKNDLTGITSITSGDNKAKITLNENDITVNNKKITGLAAGTAETDAINKKQFDDELAKKLDKATYETDKKTFVTKNEITNKIEDVEIKSADGSIIATRDKSSTDIKKVIDLKVNTNGTINSTDEKAVSGKTVHTYVEGIKNNFKTSLEDYAKKDLDNITEKGKEEIKKLVNVSKVDDNDNILEITGGTEAKGQAKDYKLSVKKSTIEGIAKEEAKKFVSDSVKVSSTDGAITVAADKTTDANVINYKLTLNKEKIKELSGTTNLATEYAKVDGTNLTNLDDTNKKAWATGIGTSSIDATTKDELVTDKAVKEYLTTEIGKVNNTVASSALKLSDGTNKESLKLADETLEIANGTNTTVTLTKDANSKKTKFTVDV